MKQTDNFTRRSVSATAILITMMWCGAAAFAQTTAFTYQGRLSDGAAAASGTYDLGFALYDAETGGTQIGTTLTRSNMMVSDGIFTVPLDFGASPFAAGASRFLQIAVKKTSEANFTTLTPRQQLTSSPYSIRTLSAAAADSLSGSCVGCVTNANINSIDGAKVTGTVQNATNAETASNVVGATNLNNANAIVRRDGSGNFIAGAISATTFNGTLDGNATTANRLSANCVGCVTNGQINSIDGAKVTGVVAIANGGTGSATKNFVDLTTAQTIGGGKTFSGNVMTNGNLFAVGGAENLRVVRGTFQVSSGVVTIIDGSGFTVTRRGVGSYIVTFTTAFPDNPTVIPSVISGATIIGTSFLSASEVNIVAFSPNGNSGDPSFVMFIAIGPK